MFTGLVEATGRVESVRRKAGGAVISISAPFAGDLSRGESVAVNGVCVTVTRTTSRLFEADAVERTVRLTTMGRITAGARVNLERAIEVGQRMGGHMVTGHVDGVGVVVRTRTTASGRDVTVEVPGELMKHVAERGSIAFDGISLTVAAVAGRRVTVSLIPETLESTVAGGYRAGVRVNLETDVLAKYQESDLRSGEAREGRKGELTLERLRELGFTE